MNIFIYDIICMHIYMLLYINISNMHIISASDTSTKRERLFICICTCMISAKKSIHNSGFLHIETNEEALCVFLSVFLSVPLCVFLHVDTNEEADEGLCVPICVPTYRDQ